MKALMRIFSPGILFPAIALALAAGEARAERKPGTIVVPCPIYAQPKEDAEVLGTYPAGSPVLVETPAQQGWHEVYFPRPYKGHPTAWIRAAYVKFSADPLIPENPAKKRLTFHSQFEGAPDLLERTSYISLSGRIMPGKPADLQTVLGENGIVWPIHVSLGATFKITDRLWAGFAGVYTTFSHSADSATIPGSYSAKGYGADFTFNYHFLRTRALLLELVPYVGISMLDFAHTYTGVRTAYTAGILTPYFGLGVRGHVPLSGAWALELNTGYETLTLTQMTIVASATTPKLMDVPLGGLSFGLGLNFGF